MSDVDQAEYDKILAVRRGGLRFRSFAGRGSNQITAHRKARKRKATAMESPSSESSIDGMAVTSPGPRRPPGDSMVITTTAQSPHNTRSSSQSAKNKHKHSRISLDSSSANSSPMMRGTGSFSGGVPGGMDVVSEDERMTGEDQQQHLSISRTIRRSSTDMHALDRLHPTHGSGLGENVNEMLQLLDRNSMTKAEAKHMVRRTEILIAELRQDAKRGHREKIHALNTKLERLSEYHDIPRVSWTK
eukprot:Clim_evm1s39 gene=Clim_evmTU1s39